MRYFFYWLIRAVAAAVSGGLVLLISLAFVSDISHIAIPPQEIATASQADLSNAFYSMVSFGVAIGLMVAAFALGGWSLSKGFAMRQTKVVLTGDGDAVVHPAVIHVEAMSPEARANWVDIHPSQATYGMTIVLALMAGGFLVAFLLGGLKNDDPIAGPLAAMGYVAGIAAYSSIAVLGGWANRKIRRWFGMPAEYIAQSMFRRDAGL